MFEPLWLHPGARVDQELHDRVIALRRRLGLLDMPAWATRAVSASAFEFISENSQIASVREFMQSLPETVRP